MKKVVSVTSNLIATSVAAVLSASLIMSGTWAWQSFDQEATNKTSDSYATGGRIHTNFNGEDKHVFVENYKTTDEGSEIFVRVRIEEYLEVGEMAGEKNEALRDPDLIDVLGNDFAEINNPDTWDIVHMGDNGAVGGILEARDYVELIFGGQGVYMPTFNKNDDSHSGDINGTLTGSKGAIRAEDWEPYSDFLQYSVEGEHSVPDNVRYIKGTAIYDMDDNDEEEKEPVISKDDNINPDANVHHSEETHDAKLTLESTAVMSMTEWQNMLPSYELYLVEYQAYEEAMIQYEKDLEAYDEALLLGTDPDELVEPTEPVEPTEVKSPIGPYWVFDTDGWVYWAQPLEPETATGLLLAEAVTLKKYEGEWYYEVSTRAQYATRGDWGRIVSDDDVNGHWGSEAENADLDDQSVTESALVLLQTISGTVIR